MFAPETLCLLNLVAYELVLQGRPQRDGSNLLAGLTRQCLWSHIELARKGFRHLLPTHKAVRSRYWLQKPPTKVRRGLWAIVVVEPASPRRLSRSSAWPKSTGASGVTKREPRNAKMFVGGTSLRVCPTKLRRSAHSISNTNSSQLFRINSRKPQTPPAGPPQPPCSLL